MYLNIFYVFIFPYSFPCYFCYSFLYFHIYFLILSQIYNFWSHSDDSTGPCDLCVPTQICFGLFVVMTASVFLYEFVLNPPSGQRHRVWILIWIWSEERGVQDHPNIKKYKNLQRPKPKHTFLVHSAEGDGGRVAVNDVQEKVCRVVVGLTGVPWEMKFQNYIK